MSLQIISHTNRTHLSKLHESLKVEQAEVTALFDLKSEEIDFEMVLLLAAISALRSSLVLRYYADLFFIKNTEFSSSVSKIVALYGDFLAEVDSTSGKRYLIALSHFVTFSKQIQKCISVIEELFKGKLDTSPKNNLIIRYLSNLKNGIIHLRNMALFASANDIQKMPH